MHNLTVREFKKEDVAAVLKLVEEMINYHHKLDPYYKASAEHKNLFQSVKRWLKDENTKIFVAIINNAIVGYIRGTIEKSPDYSRFDKVGTIDDLFIKNPYRQKKVGEQLFNTMVSWIKGKGVNELRLSVDIKNESAIKFWEKMGFEKFSLRMKKRVNML